MLRTLILPSLLVLASPLAAQNEIGFIEKFALAENRESVLGELIAGTEEYYFYHCLHFQQTGRQKELAALLDQWAKREPDSALRTEILNRQAILDYETDPQKTLAYLRDKLGLTFAHQQQNRDQRPDLAAKLNPAEISEAAFLGKALANNDNLSGISQAGIDWLMQQDPKSLSPARQRELLSKLTRPDYPGLVELLNAHLGQKESRGFGEFPVCKHLLPEQLEALRRLRPELMQRSAFVQVWLSKLAPGADVEPDRELGEKQKWLERQWSFAKGLAPKFNSLKGHVLFQRLLLERRLGEYPADLFLEYLKLPRPVAYVNPLWREKDAAAWENAVDLNQDWRPYTGCPPIGADEMLVRDYLLRLLAAAKDFSAYAPYIEAGYLKAAFAEAKLLAGVGNAEQWYSHLSAGAVQALKDREEVIFADLNPAEFDAATCKLALDIKNVPRLLVRVFEINTENYYQANARQISTDLNLDGLQPTVEKSIGFHHHPLVRHRLELAFAEAGDGETVIVPGIAKRGVWIVECIGNRRASRALLRRGRLHTVSRPSVSGNLLLVYDEARQPVKTAYALLGGQRFAADETGSIAIPFSSKPGPQSVVVGDGAGFASLETLDLKGEQYELRAGFHVPRETLLAGRDATVAVRPNFLVGGFPADPKLIEEPVLTLVFSGLDGASTVSAVPGFKLEGGTEAVHTFRVPERLSRLEVKLTGKVKSLLTGQMIDVQAAAAFDVNTVSASEHVADLHLLRLGEEWFLQQLGRNGEPLANRAVTLQFFRPQFNNPVPLTLRSDETGYTALGVLDGVSTVTAQNGAGLQRNWRLRRDAISAPSNLHAKAGEALVIPWVDRAEKPDPRKFSLLEMRGGVAVADHRDKVAAGSSLVIKGLSAGDYELRLPEEGRQLSIRITTGEPIGPFLASNSRLLEETPPAMLNLLTGLDKAGENLQIAVTGAGKAARVHVFASRFLPAFSALPLAQGAFPGPRRGQPAWLPSLYLSGRDIGDEYRYVLERRFLKKFPGNLLSRPGLILNPWSINRTQTSEKQAEGGELAQRLAEGKEAAVKAAEQRELRDAKSERTAGPSLEPDLNFLAEAAPVKMNLKPDEKGMILLPLREFGDRHYVTVVATDGIGGVVRELALPKAPETKVRDTRLKRPLDPKTHFTRQNQATVLERGVAYEIEDPLSAQFQVYADIDGVLRYFQGVSKNDTLGEFAFLADWQTFDDAKKRATYSKYACHELSFFLSRKDAKFFGATIKPYLSSKKDKTFLDRYLLGENLAEFLRPWNYNQLNIVERLLLAERIPGQRDGIRRNVKDLLAAVPVDRAAADRFFVDAYFGFQTERGREGLEDQIEMLKATAERVADPFAAPANEPVAAGGAPAGPAGGKPMSNAEGEKRDEFRAYSGADKQLKMPAEAPNARFANRLKDLGGLEAEQVTVTGAAVLKYRQNQLGAHWAGGFDAGDAGIRMDYGRRLGRGSTLYRRLEPTQEWAENNYWHLRISEQHAGLITANRFWSDYAAWDGKSPFISTHLGEATRSFAEMALALAVLDLPFANADAVVKTELKDGKLLVTAPHRSLLLHREIKPAKADAAAPKLLVSQNFFRQGDRFVEKDGEKSDKFVTEEFLTGIVYGAQVTVTNPTSSLQRLDVLFQIPQGAIPVLQTRQTQSVPQDLQPFQTFKADFYFYFPAAGKFIHYPVQVAKQEKIVGAGEAFVFNVVEKPTKEDRQSWEYVSQWGTDEDVFSFLEQASLTQVDLDLMAWRLKKPEFFRKAAAFLAARHFYHATTYSYAVLHNAFEPLQEFLLHADDFLAQCGPALDAKLLKIDPVARRTFEHLEYSPLVNARQHLLGKERTVLNAPLREQYLRLLNVLAHRAKLSAEDQISVVHYLLVQDRIAEGVGRFAGLDPASVAEKLQYDYLKAWLAVSQADAATARNIAAPYAAYPVDKWREKFAAVLSLLDELQGKAGGDAVDAEIQRERSQDAQASTETALGLKIEAKTVTLQYANAREAEVRYYPVDLEFLFSTNPFVSSDTGRFRMIRPGRTEKIGLPEGGKVHTFPLPKEFHSSNVVVEVSSAGKTETEAYYANELDVAISENYGQLQVRHAADKRPLGKVYVKVFADLNGSPKFYKDGYTDLRGKFDYASLSTGQLDGVSRFGILVISEEFGAIVREVSPPRQ